MALGTERGGSSGHVWVVETARGETWALPLLGDRKPIQLIDGRFAPYAPRLSPDGRWLAYNSLQTGRHEVNVQRFLAAGQKEKVSSGGGVHPRWTRGGRELVYWAVPGGVHAVEFSSSAMAFSVSSPRTLLQAPILSVIDGRTHYDVTRDGTKLLARQAAGPQGAGISVIVNWKARLS